MTEPHLPEDPLARAEAALRAVPVPPGPTDALIAQTVAAAEAATPAPPLVFMRRRRTTMHAFVQLAAALLVMAGGFFYFGGNGPGSPALAFAEIAEKLRAAQTLAYRMQMELPGAAKPVTVRFLFKDPGHVRAEAAPGTITIMDQAQHKTVILDSTNKTALLIDEKKAGQPATPEDAVVQMVERLRKLGNTKGESLGKKQIGNIEAQGFRMKDRDMVFQVWADPATRLPVQIESSLRLQNKEVTVRLTDFELDPRLEDTLFQVAVPAGYQVRKTEFPGARPEEEVVRLLRFYAAGSGGTFPARLDDWAALDQQFKNKKWTGTTDPELIAWVQTIIRLVQFTQKTKYGYKTEGVKLGDANKIVFWYKPADAAQYRVVYGDLRVGDVDAEQLPK